MFGSLVGVFENPKLGFRVSWNSLGGFSWALGGAFFRVRFWKVLNGLFRLSRSPFF